MLKISFTKLLNSYESRHYFTFGSFTSPGMMDMLSQDELRRRRHNDEVYAFRHGFTNF